MSLELTTPQAEIYASDLLQVLLGYSHLLSAVATLREHTPAGRVPEGLLRGLLEGWESLDNRFVDVYVQLHGKHPYTEEHDPANDAAKEDVVGA
jgi:hypothetical protein